MDSLLIVEDNDSFREVLCEIIEVRLPDLKILEATSGHEAQELFERERPSLVFMDLNIPSPNGLLVTNFIKCKDPECTVVVMSNHDGQEYQDAAASYGADHFIPKTELSMEKVSELIYKHRKGR